MKHLKNYLALPAVFVIVTFFNSCKPFLLDLYRTCDDINPPCSAREYAIVPIHREFSLQSDSSLIEELPASFVVRETSKSGIPWGCSCQNAFVASSTTISSDIVLVNGNTLKAGYNFSRGPTPAGFSKGDNGGYLRIMDIKGFRDSEITISFIGKVDKVSKSATKTFRITNPALLLPP
jgi:hypothetical protein